MNTAETTQNRDKSKCGKLRNDYVSSHVRYDHFDTTAYYQSIIPQGRVKIKACTKSLSNNKKEPARRHRTGEWNFLLPDEL